MARCLSLTNWSNEHFFFVDFCSAFLGWLSITIDFWLFWISLTREFPPACLPACEVFSFLLALLCGLLLCCFGCLRPPIALASMHRRAATAAAAAAEEQREREIEKVKTCQDRKVSHRWIEKWVEGGGYSNYNNYCCCYNKWDTSAGRNNKQVKEKENAANLWPPTTATTTATNESIVIAVDIIRLYAHLLDFSLIIERFLISGNLAGDLAPVFVSHRPLCLSPWKLQKSNK